VAKEYWLPEEQKAEKYCQHRPHFVAFSSIKKREEP